MSKKVLIYFEKNKLEPVGGPAGYLWNLNNELEKKQVSNIYFLDSKINEKRKKYKQLFTKMPKIIQNFYYNSKKKKYGKKIISEIFDKKERLANINLNEYDVIHFHDTLSMYRIKDSLKNYKGKVILTSHSPKASHLEIIDKMSQKDKKIYSEQIKKMDLFDEYAFNRADYIHFPAKEAEECYYNTWKKYKKIHEKNSKKYIYIPTGIGPIRVNSDKQEIREKYNIPADAFVISYVGRHNEVKGYANLKEIAEKVFKQEDNIYFLIGGKEEPLKGLNNPRWIEVGWTNKPHDLINCSDLFILPNMETYFDLIMLEVLSVGKTMLVTDTGGNKYFKKFKESGIFYYEYGNIEEAIKQIEKIKKKNLKKLELLNKKIVKENFTISIFADKYIEMIENL